ncbi:MAG: MFS transporter [Actinomycetales bacterium]|nr:MFS transporter [Actinomycetales bacterium]
MTSLPARLAGRLGLAGLPREVAVIALVAFLVAIGFGIVGPAIPVFAETFGVSTFAASAVISVFALMRFIGSPLAGWLVDRIGERVILSSGLTIVAVSSGLAGLAQSYSQLLLLRGVGGIGSAMFTVSAFSALLRIVSPEQRGRAASVFSGGFLLGGLSGPAVGGLVLSLSYRLPFFLYAASLLAAAVVSGLLLSRARLDALEQADREASGAPPAAATGPGLGAVLRALADPAYRAAVAANFSSGFSAFGLRASLMPLFVILALAASPVIIGLGFLVASITQAAALLPAGRLTDLRGRRPAMLIGSVLMVVALVLLAVWETIPGFLVAMAALGIGVAYLAAAPAAVVGDVLGGRKGGPLVAGYQMASDLGAIVGPLLAGALADAFGFPLAFASGAVVAALVVVLAARMPETLGRRLTPLG